MPNQGNGDSKVIARVPTNVKSAIQAAAHAQSTPYETVTVSDIIRDALENHLARLAAEGGLPPEAMDDLDDDLLADAGAGLEDIDVDVDNGGEGE